MDDIRVNYDLNHRKMVEEHILGAIINVAKDRETRGIIERHNVIVNDFYFTIHKDIFESILECYKREVNPTLTSVTQFRPEKYRYNNSTDFSVKVIDLIQKGAITLNNLDHNLLFLKQYVLMDFWNFQANDILYGNWNGRDVLQVGDTIVNEYSLIMKRITTGIVKQSLGESYENEILIKAHNRKLGLTVGVPTTVQPIDDFMAGYSPAELIIIAGRPGMGKTTFALISAWESSKLGNPIAFFSLEMPKNQLISKIISLETGIDYYRIKAGNVTPEELSIILQWSNYIERNSNFYIYDRVKTIEDIAETTAKAVAEKGIKMIMIDYIQRCKTRTQNKLREAITEISRECKGIAKEHYIPVVALSQLSRRVEDRTNKRPVLSDLKESGAIEEDADVVAFLFRQAYYDQQNGVDVPLTELFHTEFIIAKGRDIGLKNIHIYLDAINMKIYEYGFTNTVYGNK